MAINVHQYFLSLQFSSMTNYKVIYFNGRGRAEIIRLTLTQAKQSFSDTRVQGEEWTKLKPSTPKGQLPVLEIDGKMICESMAITRHLGRELGLYGKTNLEATTCDMVLESIAEIINACVTRKFRAKTEEEIAAADEKINLALQRCETFLARIKQGKYVLGDQASIADIAIFDVCDMARWSMKSINVDEYTVMNEIANTFSSQEHIKAYVSARPETTF
ncbi:HPGDS [Bugula neritina]|uniref:HPGDS n=1 Tax=Bugula neritina TaxID=10212 RepID=A0A7J7J5H8_BUGNE|nr:HPGDS [Bugula neritina]